MTVRSRSIRRLVVAALAVLLGAGAAAIFWRVGVSRHVAGEAWSGRLPGDPMSLSADARRVLCIDDRHEEGWNLPKRLVAVDRELGPFPGVVLDALPTLESGLMQVWSCEETGDGRLLLTISDDSDIDEVWLVSADGHRGVQLDVTLATPAATPRQVVYDRERNEAIVAWTTIMLENPPCHAGYSRFVLDELPLSPATGDDRRVAPTAHHVVERSSDEDSLALNDALLSTDGRWLLVEWMQESLPPSQTTTFVSTKPADAAPNDSPTTERAVVRRPVHHVVDVVADVAIVHLRADESPRWTGRETPALLLVSLRDDRSRVVPLDASVRSVVVVGRVVHVMDSVREKSQLGVTERRRHRVLILPANPFDERQPLTLRDWTTSERVTMLGYDFGRLLAPGFGDPAGRFTLLMSHDAPVRGWVVENAGLVPTDGLD